MHIQTVGQVDDGRWKARSVHNRLLLSIVEARPAQSAPELCCAEPGAQTVPSVCVRHHNQATTFTVNSLAPQTNPLVSIVIPLLT